jgi:hypothetical protein
MPLTQTLKEIWMGSWESFDLLVLVRPLRQYDYWFEFHLECRTCPRLQCTMYGHASWQASSSPKESHKMFNIIFSTLLLSAESFSSPIKYRRNLKWQANLYVSVKEDAISRYRKRQKADNCVASLCPTSDWEEHVCLSSSWNTNMHN